MRQGWVVSIHDNNRDETKYKIAWKDSLEEATTQAQAWGERLFSNHGDRFTVEVSFPYGEYGAEDYVEVKCHAESQDVLREACSAFDAFVNEGAGNEYLIEVYRGDLDGLLNKLEETGVRDAHLNLDVSILAEQTNALMEAIDKAAEIKRRDEPQAESA